MNWGSLTTYHLYFLSVGLIALCFLLLLLCFCGISATEDVCGFCIWLHSKSLWIRQNSFNVF